MVVRACTCIVPVQELFDVFVVIEEVSIDSENVTEIDVLVETVVSPLDGEVDVTVGGVVSDEVVVELSEVDELSEVEVLSVVDVSSEDVTAVVGS